MRLVRLLGDVPFPESPEPFIPADDVLQSLENEPAGCPSSPFVEAAFLADSKRSIVTMSAMKTTAPITLTPETVVSNWCRSTPKYFTVAGSEGSIPTFFPLLAIPTSFAVFRKHQACTKSI